jgi:separase
MCIEARSSSQADDQVGIDVVTALTEMEASSKPIEESPDGPEHLLLALDKNVHSLPWESMPCLRGRAVSRVPSLPVLLDQVALGKIMQPGSTRRTVNSKKTHFILNPSGDLVKTQAAFEPFLKDMQERAGWKGVIGQKPSELEMTNILKDNELVLYVFMLDDEVSADR